MCIFQPEDVLNLSLRFSQSQPRYAYKHYVYKQKRLYNGKSLILLSFQALICTRLILAKSAVQQLLVFCVDTFRMLHFGQLN